MKVQVLVAFVLCTCASAAPAATQLTKSSIFLRTTIETYPEAERRPILDYLDAARGVADQAAADFAAGNDERVLTAIDRAAKATNQHVDVRPVLEQMRRAFGRVTSYEYRAQAIEQYGDQVDVHDLGRATSTTYYAVRTTKQPGVEQYLMVKTARVGAEHILFQIQITDYAGAVPPWLKAK